MPVTSPIQPYSGPPGELPAGLLPPAQAFTYSPTGPNLIFSGECIIIGWSFYNPAAATDNLTLYDGTDANGQPIGFVHAPAAATVDTETLGCSGLLLRRGLYITSTAQKFQGAVWLILL